MTSDLVAHIFGMCNTSRVSTAAIPGKQLFGHEKGAFSGAINGKVGRLDLADRGTLFLEKGRDIPIEIQPARP
jgi:transcriptional regulator with GAF, ATPase, and Fis domain